MQELAIKQSLQLDASENQIVSLGEQFRQLQERNEQRLDDVLAKQNEILDQRLGLNQPGKTPTDATRPLRTNGNWPSIKRTFESKRREEYWTKKIEEQERDIKVTGEPSQPVKDQDVSDLG